MIAKPKLPLEWIGSVISRLPDPIRNHSVITGQHSLCLFLSSHEWSLAEFAQTEQDFRFLWGESGSVDGTNSSLKSVVTRHLLQARVVDICVVRPEIVSVWATIPPDQDIAAWLRAPPKGVLPVNIDPEQVLFSACRKGPDSKDVLVSYARPTDIASISKLTREAGLEPRFIFPGGHHWYSLLTPGNQSHGLVWQGQKETFVSLQANGLADCVVLPHDAGTPPAEQDIEQAKSQLASSLSVPTPEKTLCLTPSPVDGPSGVDSMDNAGTGVTDSFRNTPLHFVPAAEALFVRHSKAILNLQRDTTRSLSILRTAKWALNVTRAAITVPVTLFLVIGLLFILAAIADFSVGRLLNIGKENSAEYVSARREKRSLSKSLRFSKNLLDKQTNLSQILYDVGKSVPGEAWFSELSATGQEQGGFRFALIGHCADAASATKTLAGIEKIPGIKSARIVYSEKLDKRRVYKMSGRRRLRRPLVRFKIEMQAENRF